MTQPTDTPDPEDVSAFADQEDDSPLGHIGGGVDDLGDG
jgi:hypothetical protein